MISYCPFDIDEISENADEVFFAYADFLSLQTWTQARLRNGSLFREKSFFEFLDRLNIESFKNILTPIIIRKVVSFLKVRNLKDAFDFLQATLHSSYNLEDASKLCAILSPNCLWVDKTFVQSQWAKLNEEDLFLLVSLSRQASQRLNAKFYFNPFGKEWTTSDVALVKKYISQKFL